MFFLGGSKQFYPHLDKGIEYFNFKCLNSTNYRQCSPQCK